MHLLLLRALPFLLFAALIAVSSCDNEVTFVSGNDVNLRFSTDTVMFDTVFAARGSATQIMKVYNDAADPVTIDRVYVEGRTGVDYSFNIDGFSGPEARDVVVWGGDSIFVFVEVLVDPTEPEVTSPFLAEDRLLFETGDNSNDIVLMSFGQNANYVFGFNRGQFSGWPNCNGGTVVLPNDLPTVVFGSMIIDNCTVRAVAGTKIYVHGGVQRNPEIGGNGFFNDGIIFTTESGRLELIGTLEEPIVVSTDRLEERFRDDPAKYRGIVLGAGSRGNLIQHTEILNSIAGVTLDSTAEVTIENSTIAYAGGPAVSAYQAEVNVSNSLFHSNFGNTVQFIKGGRLNMIHTTLASYGVDASALVLTNFTCDEDGDNCIAAPLDATVNNSVVAGSSNAEIGLFDIFRGGEAGTFEVRITNSVVRTDERFLTDEDGLYADFYERICTNCVNYDLEEPLFQDARENDYHLDSLSVARSRGVFLPAFAQDILGNERFADSTDAGAFQFVAGE